MKAILGLAAVALVVGGSGLVTPAEPARGSLYAELERIALERSGGDLDQEGAVIVWHGDGSSTVVPIDGHAFLAEVRAVTRMVDEGTDAASPTASGGVGFGFRESRVGSVYQRAMGSTIEQDLGWPFCDVASIFMFHTGPPGLAVKEATRASVEIPVSRETLCNNFFNQPSTSWEDVTLDSNGLPGLVRNCGAAMVMLPQSDPNEVQSLTGGYMCNKRFSSATGNGVVASMVWPLPPRAGMTMDSFRGAGNFIFLGDEAN